MFLCAGVPQLLVSRDVEALIYEDLCLDVIGGESRIIESLDGRREE